MDRIIFITFFLLLSFVGYSSEIIFINNSKQIIPHSVFIKLNDTITFINNDLEHENYYWSEIEPIQENYDNSNQVNLFQPDSIKYQITIIQDSQIYTKIFKELGTKYIACIKKSDFKLNTKTFSTNLPINKLNDFTVIQIVVRLDDTYIGYLTELINTPFIMPVLNIIGYGHQTDLRIGSDCAELAIYGKRREGYKIPYCGPYNIINYLQEIDKNQLFEGCIVHFGSQVSVLFEDNGAKNILDKDDILIQSYLTKVKLVDYYNSGFYDKSYKLYKWNEEYEKK